MVLQAAVQGRTTVQQEPLFTKTSRAIVMVTVKKAMSVLRLCSTAQWLRHGAGQVLAAGSSASGVAPLAALVWVSSEASCSCQQQLAVVSLCSECFR